MCTHVHSSKTQKTLAVEAATCPAPMTGSRGWHFHAVEPLLAQRSISLFHVTFRASVYFVFLTYFGEGHRVESYFAF